MFDDSRLQDFLGAGKKPAANIASRIRTPVDLDPTVGPPPDVADVADAPAWSARNCWTTEDECSL